MGRAAEVITVVGVLQPTALAGRFASLAARGLGAVALPPRAARVGSKEGLTVLALTFREWTFHRPASPQAHDRGLGGWKEENGEGKSAPKKTEENGRRGEILPVGKKTERPNQHFHPDRLHAVSGRR